MALTVNGEVIDNALIEREAENMRAEYEKQFAQMVKQDRYKQLMEWAQENIIERTLLQQEASARNIIISDQDLDTAFKQMKEECQDLQALYKQTGCSNEDQLKEFIKKSMQTEKLLAEIQDNAPEASPEDIAKYYKDHKDQFQIPLQVSCAHIVKHLDFQTTEEQARTAIQEAKDKLDKGESFESVAAQFSDCADQGGSLGYITKGQMVEEFEDIVFNLGPGQISDVFSTRFGFHIATVYDRKPASVEPLENVSSSIKKQLQEEIKANSVYEFIDQLKAKASIDRDF